MTFDRDFWKLLDRVRVEGRPVEPQARAPRVLRAAAESAATDHSAGAAADPPAAHRAAGLNQTWALDFMTETLYDGRRVRLRTIIDEGNRDGREIAMGLSLPNRRVD